MGLFKRKFKDWPIVKEGKSLLIEGSKQVPFLGRIVTAIFDRGESGKFSLKDFKWPDVYALGIGGLILFGIVKGWFTLSEINELVEQLLSIFS